MKKKPLIALLALLPLASCVTTSTTILDSTAAASPIVAPEAVKIYLSEADLPKGTKKLGIITGRGDNDLTTPDGMFRAAKREAAKIGGNGVLVQGMREPSAGAAIAGAFLGYSAQRQGEFVAVRTP